MTRPLNSDPLRNFSYLVTMAHPLIPSLAQFGFMAVSGFGVQNEVIAYREGGNNTTTRKMPGQSDYGPLTFTRGLMAAPVTAGGASTNGVGTNEIYQWQTQLFSVQAGGGLVGGVGIDFRIGVVVDVLEFPITVGPSASGVNTTPPVKARYQVYNAWPMGYSHADLEAGGNAIIVETLTLAHEGWNLITASQDPASFLGASTGFSG